MFEWATLAQDTYPELEYLHAVPNGGHRHPSVAKRMVAEGVKGGVFDVFLDVPRGGFHGLRIEMKAPRAIGHKPGSLSKEQVRWLIHYIENGYCAVICYGFQSAKETIEIYLRGKTDGGSEKV